MARTGLAVSVGSWVFLNVDFVTSDLLLLDAKRRNATLTQANFPRSARSRSLFLAVRCDHVSGQRFRVWRVLEVFDSSVCLVRV